MGFFDGPYFNPVYKTKVHILQIVMVIGVFALAIAKMITKPSYVPMNRMDMIGLTMGGKTIIVIAYQLLTEHISRFQKWGSLRANAILNTLETLLWFVVIILTFWGISMVCIGVSCAFGWLIALMAFLMSLVCFWTAVVCWKEFRHFKNGGSNGFAKTQMDNV